MGKTPAFYNPKLVGELRQPNLLAAQQEGATAGLLPASKSKRTKALVLVDMQVDFCFPAPIGNLPVSGSIDDTRRVIEELIFRDAENITSILCSLDQHIPFQIFFPTWWADKSGKHPAPYTLIKADEVNQGIWRPLYEAVWSVEYIDKLGAMMIWPFHCMVGTPGAALVPSLSEAIMWHAAARRTQPIYVFKGSVPQTEHYGIWAPCVLYPKHPQGGLNTVMLDTVAKNDLIIVCGEARDYCVKTTMQQMLDYFKTQPEVIKKIRFVRDCTSLALPDNAAQEDEFLKEMAKKGVQIVTAKEAVG